MNDEIKWLNDWNLENHNPPKNKLIETTHAHFQNWIKSNLSIRISSESKLWRVITIWTDKAEHIRYAFERNEQIVEF